MCLRQSRKCGVMDLDTLNCSGLVCEARTKGRAICSAAQRSRNCGLARLRCIITGIISALGILIKELLIRPLILPPQGGHILLYHGDVLGQLRTALPTYTENAFASLAKETGYRVVQREISTMLP
jgi:hypothetical protein